MTKHLRKFIIATLAVTALSGCGDAKEQLGLTRSAPDEFAVVKRAPLEMPPEFSLRPPEPGAPRPQELSTVDQAATTVLGPEQAARKKAKSGQGLTTGESALITEANVRYNPDIRQIVDEEAANTAKKDQPVVKKLLDLGSDQLPPATVVDPTAEAARIKKNAAEGKSVTEGKTPVIEE